MGTRVVEINLGSFCEGDELIKHSYPLESLVHIYTEGKVEPSDHINPFQEPTYAVHQYDHLRSEGALNEEDKVWLEKIVNQKINFITRVSDYKKVHGRIVGLQLEISTGSDADRILKDVRGPYLLYLLKEYWWLLIIGVFLFV